MILPLLSAMTNLTSLHLVPSKAEDEEAESFSFCSLQPLSTLQQLQVLHLEEGICTGTSLQGLASLSSLEKVNIACKESGSLQGLSPSITSLCLQGVQPLRRLAGIEAAASLQELILLGGRLASLQGLGALSELQAVSIYSPSILDGDSSSSLEAFQAVKQLSEDFEHYQHM